MKKFFAKKCIINRKFTSQKSCFSNLQHPSDDFCRFFRLITANAQ